MVAAPLNFRGDLKISDENNWRGGGGGGPEQKLNLGVAEFKGGPKILGFSNFQVFAFFCSFLTCFAFFLKNHPYDALTFYKRP